MQNIDIEIQNTNFVKDAKKSTKPGIPWRSPIQVLTRLNIA